MRRPLALLFLLALSACGETPEASGEDEASVTDTTLAIILVDVHLAAARSETTGEPLDSLLAIAYARHATDSTALARRLADHTERPEDLSALYGAVQELLSRPSSQTP